MSADVKASDYEKVLVALGGATRLTRSQVRNLFGRHRSQAQLDALANALEADGHLLRMWIPPGDGHDSRVEVWEKAMAQSAKNGNGSVPKPPDAVPPPGEGWLPKAKTLRRAQRGVVPAVAAREGRSVRKKEAAQKARAAEAKGQPAPKPGTSRVSDAQRGAAHLIGHAHKSYKDQGIIEEQGDWIRLAKNPTRRPPHHWYESLLHFLADAHPTLDGKWRRKPKKTLIGVMEDALGRKLEPNEIVRRRPNTAGSWNPDDIVLHDYSIDTMVTLADVRARAER